MLYTIPKFGDIWDTYLEGMPITADGMESHTWFCNKTALAIKQFFTELINNYSICAFMSTGEVVIAPVTTPLAGKIAGFNNATVLFPIDGLFVHNKFKLPDFWLGFFLTFGTMIDNTMWMLDCKGASYASPYPAKVQAITYTGYVQKFKAQMKAANVTSHTQFTKLINDGVKTFIKNYFIAEVPYVGTGAGTYTSTIVISF